MADQVNTIPYEIDPSSLEGQIWTIVRYTVSTVGGYLVGRGLIKADDLNAVLGMLVFLVPAGFGVYSTYKNKQKLLKVAEVAPDTKAVITEKK